MQPSQSPEQVQRTPTVTLMVLNSEHSVLTPQEPPTTTSQVTKLLRSPRSITHRPQVTSGMRLSLYRSTTHQVTLEASRSQTELTPVFATVSTVHPTTWLPIVLDTSVQVVAVTSLTVTVGHTRSMDTMLLPLETCLERPS